MCVCYTHENDHGPRELHFPMTILEVAGGLLVASALGDIFALDLHSEGQRGMVMPWLLGVQLRDNQQGNQYFCQQI